MKTILFVSICILLIVSCHQIENSINDGPDLDDPDLIVDLNVSDQILTSQISYCDVYSQDSKLIVFWNAINFPRRFDSLRVLISSISPDSGYVQAGTSAKLGLDSLEIFGLENFKNYFVRIALDSNGVLFGNSRALMASPGNCNLLLHTIDAPQIEPPIYVSNISWHPNNQKLAYIKANSNLIGSNIYEHDLNSSMEQSITSYSGDDYRLLSVKHSPNATSIAYSYTPSATYASIDYRIWLRMVNSDTLYSVSSGRVDGDVFWQDTSKLVFSKGSYSTANIHQIYTLDLTTLSETPVTNGQTLQKSTPTINSSNQLIYSAEGSNFRYLYEGPTEQQINYKKKRYWSDLFPNWINGTNRIVFSSNRSGHFEVWILDYDSKDVMQLSRTQERHSHNMYGRINNNHSMMALLRYNESYTKATIRIEQLSSF